MFAKTKGISSKPKISLYVTSVYSVKRLVMICKPYFHSLLIA